MSTVYVHNIRAFDADKSQSITFGYSGSQCIKNKITVYDNSTNSIVYEKTIVTFSLSNAIPSGTLVNGKSYKCTITAYYMEANIEKNVTSSFSNIFYCLSAPTWGLNVSESDVVNNSYFTFIPTYIQAQGEDVDEYYIVIYNTSGSVFWSSDTLYDVGTPTTVDSLPNDTTLYVRAYGTTVNGLSFDTRNPVSGLDVMVFVDYIAPQFYSIAYLENNKWQGHVKAKTNVASVEGHTLSGKDAVFIGDTYIDLKNETIIFDENFVIIDKFIVQKTGHNISVNKPYLRLMGDGYEAVVTLRRGTFDVGERVFMELKAKNGEYVVNSNLIGVPTSNDLIHLWVERKGSLYSVKVSNKGAV